MTTITKDQLADDILIVYQSQKKEWFSEEGDNPRAAFARIVEWAKARKTRRQK